MPPSLPSQPSQPYPRTRPLRPVRLRRRVLTLTGLGLAGLIAGLLSGCAASVTASNPVEPGYAQLAGNWGFGAAVAGSATRTAQLTALGGSLAVNGASVTGMLHALTPGQCLAPSELIPVNGTIGTDAGLTLSGSSANGIVIHIAGTVAGDRHSLSGATLSATGGACSAAALRTSAAAVPRDSPGTTAQQYQPVSGTYAGTLLTAEGESFPLTTTVTQLDQPDASGIYHIQGTAASAGNTCLPSAVSANASTLSGGTLSATYTDAMATTSISAAGSASPDGATLTLTNWSLSSACGSDTGTGTLTRQ